MDRRLFEFAGYSSLLFLKKCFYAFFLTAVYLAFIPLVYYTTNKRLGGVSTTSPARPGVYSGPGVKSRKYGTMKRNQQHGSKSINNNLQTWPFEPTEESRMFPEKSVIYFGLDVSCLLQSAAMVAKKLLVGAKITACFKQICFCMLLCKFRSEKNHLVKHFAFLKTFAINI